LRQLGFSNKEIDTLENESTPFTQERPAFIKAETKYSLNDVKKNEKRQINKADQIGVSVEDLQKIYNKMKDSKKTRKEPHHHFQDAHQGIIQSVAVTSDSKFIISGSSDKSIKVFDILTKQEVHHFQDAHQNYFGGCDI